MEHPSNTSARSAPAWLKAPMGPRVLPFLVFTLMTSLPTQLYPGDLFWNYALKTLLVGGLLVWLRPWLPEMKWAVSPEALGVGLGVAVLWIFLDARMNTHPKPEDVWNPVAFFKEAPWIGWGLVAIRVLGRSIVVPMVEEVFYRSFIYRLFIDPRFTEISLNTYKPVAFLGGSLLFGLAHGSLWLPGILCGLAYQFLTLRRNRIGDAMTAHAITNLLISLWTLWRGEWRFT